jgi:N utilization substance protein A
MDEENRKFEVVAPDSQLSLAIGRRGQNVRLASILIGWNVTVVSETEALEKSNQEYHLRSKIFMEALDCDEVIAHLLVAEGFSEITEVAGVSKEDLSSVEGFDESLSEELISRANNYLKKKEKEVSDKIKTMDIDKKILEIEALSNDMIMSLAEKGIINLDNLADLSADELIEIIPNLDQETANDVIMKAREHWFK